MPSDVAMVSLTVTEKGYCHDPATGELDDGHPDIVHDLANPDRPRSALGFLLAAINERRARGLRPFTPLTCDNLSGNGHTLHQLLVQMARRASLDLAGFIEDRITCPDTMVDRIVPATTAVDRLAISEAIGVEDAWPVVTEPFSQWVIENRFVSERPEWERFGATLAQNVAPYEMMKLRLLNASHSAIAYIGLLAGYSEVAQAMGDDGIALFVARLMDDAQETVDVPADANIRDYMAFAVERFAIRHSSQNCANRHGRLAEAAAADSGCHSGQASAGQEHRRARIGDRCMGALRCQPGNGGIKRPAGFADYIDGA